MTIFPYAYMCFDLETADASPDIAWRDFVNHWHPQSIAEWKEETIGKRAKEAYAKCSERLGLSEHAPIAVVSIKSDSEFRLLHCIEPEIPHLVEGATVQGFATERDMLIAFRTLLSFAVVLPGGATADALPPTELVAHNGRSFDMPKLRTRMLANGLQLPPCFIDERMPLFDTMKVYSHRFAVKGDGFIGIDAICEAMNIPTHKHLIDGAQIPGMVRDKRTKEVVTYALIDCLKVEHVYLRMTGRHPNLV